MAFSWIPPFDRTEFGLDPGVVDLLGHWNIIGGLQGDDFAPAFIS
jgi:hypothetical protein